MAVAQRAQPFEPTTPRRSAYAAPARFQALQVTALVLLAAPLFFDFRTGRVLATSLFVLIDSSSVIAIHTSALVIPPLFAVLVARRVAVGERLPRRIGSTQVAAMLIVFTFSIALGVILDRSSLALIFYGQTVMPFFAFYVGAYSTLRTARMASIVIATVAVSSVVVLAAIANAGTIKPDELTRLLVTAIPQYRNFFPGTLMVGIALAVNYRYRFPKLATVALITFALTLPFLWSRAGLGMIAIVGGASVVLYMRTPSSGRTHRRSLVIAAVLIVGAVASFALINSSVVANRIDNSGVVAGGPGDQRRLQLAETAIGYIIDNPFTGRSFLPEAELLRDPNDVVGTFKAHNQYLDYALKGGLLAVALLIAFLVISLRSNLRLWRYGSTLESRRLGAAMVAIILAAAFGNMFHLLFVQPYTAILIFFLLGFASSRAAHLPAASRRLVRRRTAEGRPS